MSAKIVCKRVGSIARFKTGCGERTDDGERT